MQVLAADGLKVSWVENVIGTEGADTITGNADANVIVMMGGADTINGFLGDDLIIAADMDNVLNATLIDGGSGKDTLKILDSEIDLTAAGGYDAVVKHVEVLKVGYDLGDETTAVAATVTVDGTTFDPKALGLTEIDANDTKEYTKKGVEIFDTIVSTDQDLNLTGVTLKNFERISVASGVATGGVITIGTGTFGSLKEVVGDATNHDTTLVLVGKDGDVFDMSAPKFIDIATLLAPVDATGTEIKATLVMGQKQLDTLAFSGDFSQDTLQLKGMGVDMTGVDFTGMADGADADGFGGFKEIVFGANDTKTLVLSDAGVDALNGEPDSTWCWRCNSWYNYRWF